MWTSAGTTQTQSLRRLIGVAPGVLQRGTRLEAVGQLAKTGPGHALRERI